MRAVIIDDEAKGINGLRLLIEKTIPSLKVVASTTDPTEGIKIIEDYQPEIVFLDINMPMLNGFEVLGQLSFKKFCLIFTTAHEEYALQAIRNSALDYLLKPIDPDDLSGAVEKARIRLSQESPDFTEVLAILKSKEEKRFAIPSKEGLVYEYLENIVRLEADSNYTRIFLSSGKQYLIPKTLKDFEKTLCDDAAGFMRLHQSHIVNLSFVSRYIKEDGGIVVMKDDFQISVSKNKKEEFLKWLDI
jgi:two-component system, LytTR family, response regulator